MHFPVGKGWRFCVHPGHQEQLESEASKVQAQCRAQALCPVQSRQGPGKSILGSSCLVLRHAGMTAYRDSVCPGRGILVRLANRTGASLLSESCPREAERGFFTMHEHWLLNTQDLVLEMFDLAGHDIPCHLTSTIPCHYQKAKLSGICLAGITRKLPET